MPARIGRGEEVKKWLAKANQAAREEAKDIDDAHTLERGADKINDAFADGLIKSGVLDDLLARTEP